METWKAITKRYSNYLIEINIKDIPRRLSALTTIEGFIEKSYSKLFKGNIFLNDISKNELRDSYYKWKGKDLSGAEKQVFNDLYKISNPE